MEKRLSAEGADALAEEIEQACFDKYGDTKEYRIERDPLSSTLRMRKTFFLGNE